ncbi:MAG: undecaprenyl/decaprenyl-phosphate alpha-N-acetylglucosaminyl 1-phosphate transferase [Phycisphaeraceae bacterium]|nr:undecaprenyl/decaprenyl-phosphate alpha-N-acetylglucosaminyl 1-phosphate transferase [Phycisphaeraceae bacterium]
MDPALTENWMDIASGHLDPVLSPYMGVFFAAFVVSFLATPMMRRLAIANGVVDWPDHKRKAHLQPVAYLGGVALYLGWMAGVSLCLFLSSPQMPLSAHVAFPIEILLGASIILVTGLVDDIWGVTPLAKIGGQLMAAGCLASQKVGSEMLGAKLVTLVMATMGLDIPYWPAYVLGTAIIAMFVLGGCNSVNLLDGLDGLASGVSAIAMGGFLVIAVYVSVHAGMAGGPTELANANRLYDPVRVVMCLAVLGALMGFLPYNFNPANIFMGDAGSLLLGYLCTSTILLFVHADLMGPFLVLAALIVFGVPITDTTLAIVRRKLKGQPLFSPDNQHLHHQVLRAVKNLRLGPNLSVKLTVLIIYGIGFVFACLGVGMIFLRARYVLAVFMVFFAFVMVMAYKLGQQQVILHKLGADDPSKTPIEPRGSEAGPGNGSGSSAGQGAETAGRR